MMKSRKSIQAAEFSDFLKKSPTVEDLLSNDKTVEEVCCCNPELSNYLTPSRLKELINYIITEPENPSDSIRSCKFPMIASEFFSSDLNIVNKLLLSDSDLMNHLFSFVSSNNKLNYLLAGYFQKAFDSLLAFDSETFTNFIFSHNLHLDLLNKLQSTSVAEMIFSILQQKVNLDERRKLICEIGKRVNDPSVLISYNSAGILGKVGKEEEIFEVLTGEFMVDLLLSHLNSEFKFVVRNSGWVLKYILSLAPEKVVGLVNKEIGNLARILCEDFSPEVQTQFGLKIEKFGEHRLAILDIFSLLCLHAEAQVVDFIPQILNLFQSFAWNSYFHNSFTSFIESILNSQNKVLVEVLSRSNFPSLLINLTENSLVEAKGKVLISKGNVGHLYKIINILVNSKVDVICDALKVAASWNEFETKLQSYNEVEAKTIGGKVNVNFFDNMSSDSTDKADELDLLPDYPHTKPITGKELDDLNELFDLEDKKPQKSPFMSTKIVQTATLEELKANEFLDNVFWKIEAKVDNLDEVE